MDTPLPTSADKTPDEDERHKLVQKAALLSCLSAGLAVQLVSGWYVKDPLNNSKRSGPELVSELRGGHPERFRRMLGLHKHVFDKLLDILEIKGGIHETRHMRTDEQLAIFLYIATSGETNRRVQETFQRSADTVSKCFHRIICALTSNKIYSTYIKLPRGSDPTAPEIQASSGKLFPYFQNCLGALDGTHIPASVPAEERPRYRNRKGFVSQNILAVVSFDMRFLYVLSGWEGSAADSAILEDARAKDFLVPHSKFYLGDAGFPASPSVLVPYRGVRYHLREWSAGNKKPQNAKELFNLRHAQARNVVERIFGVFKKRFRVFATPLEYPLEAQAALVQALCVIHNIIRIYDPTDSPYVDDLEEEETDDDGEQGSVSGQRERVEGEGLRNKIAEQMWKDYLTECQRRRGRRSGA